MSMMPTNLKQQNRILRLVNFYRAFCFSILSKGGAIVVLLILAGCEAREPKKVFSFTNVQVVDWSTGKILPDMLVVFSDNDVYWVTPMSSIQVSEHPENIPMQGKFICTGITDFDVKLSGHPLDSASLKPLLKRGVTSCVIRDATKSDIIRYFNLYDRYQYSMPDCYFTTTEKMAKALRTHKKLTQISDSAFYNHVLVQTEDTSEIVEMYQLQHRFWVEYQVDSELYTSKIFYTYSDTSGIKRRCEVWGSGYAVSQDNTYGDTLANLYSRLDRNQSNLHQYLFNSTSVFADSVAFGQPLKDHLRANVFLIDNEPTQDFKKLQNPLAVVKAGNYFKPISQ